MRITFFGPPGSGKGTQADRISDYFGLKHISTGILCREEIKSGSELGKRIREIVESGHLVSDEIMNEEVFKSIESLEGFLLDGYPRNLSQARSLDEFLEKIGKLLSGAVFIHVPDEEVMRRLSERLVCDCSDGRSNTAGDHSKEGDICPVCGQKFVKRSDDISEVVKNRLHHFHTLTRHLEKYYENRLLVIDGLGSIDQVNERIRKDLLAWE
ncbi:MAG: nucleoside monophosphate kinase [Candidatus Aegiribacteria sp.]|nr:nucleoside monophosphate kinase [Candidatus Aegiribacteria sp.]